MSFVIDQMSYDGPPAPEAPRTPAAPGAAPPAKGPPDLDRLDFHRTRQRHRAERLWAD
jgi:hypothetical protein